MTHNNAPTIPVATFCCQWSQYTLMMVTGMWRLEDY